MGRNKKSIGDFLATGRAKNLQMGAPVETDKMKRE
jgi:hypothetical protein